MFLEFLPLGCLNAPPLGPLLCFSVLGQQLCIVNDFGQFTGPWLR